LFKEIESFSEDFKKVFVDQDLPFKKHRLRLLTFDLQSLIGTISLAKMYVFNITNLHNEDIEEILKNEQNPEIITDLMHIFVFTA